jgi:signal transduction histidine kinase
MAGLGCIAIGAVWLIARRQARRLAGPLERLSRTAQRLGEGDFSVRAEPVRVPEIDAVGSALNITAARLDDLLARERAFSADASHQLGTPLAGLRLRLEAALDESESQLRRAVTAGIADVDRLERTIEELLALAGDTRESRPLDLPVIFAEMEPDWHARLDARGRHLRVVIDSRAPRGVASAAAVRQILTVLLDNAATHGSGSVTVTTRNAAGALAIDVADQGPPIGAPEAELFARRSCRATGHGIGLALARRLAEAEGGRLRLTHPLPPTFSLLLPAGSAPAGDETDRSSAGLESLVGTSGVDRLTQ